VTAPILEFYPNALPAVTTTVNSSLGFAIRIGCMDSFNDETEFIAYYAKEKYYTLLVYGCVSKAAKIDGRAEFYSRLLSPL
jgi:hypothetical protein